MPTSSEEPLSPPLAASSPMKGSLWALLRLISRVYCGKAASESEQTGPYEAAIRPPSELRTAGRLARRPLRRGHKAAKTSHEPLDTSHEH